MKKDLIPFLLTLYLISPVVYGQARDTLDNFGFKEFFLADTKHSFALKGEYIYQGRNYLSLGGGYLNPRYLDGGPCNSFILGTEGFSLNTDIALTNKNFHVIPKVSYEFTCLVIATKLSLGVPTDFKSNSILFCPEAGFSFFGYGYVFYGYNFLLTNNAFDLSRNKLTIGINYIHNVKDR